MPKISKTKPAGKMSVAAAKAAKGRKARAKRVTKKAA